MNTIIKKHYDKQGDFLKDFEPLKDNEFKNLKKSSLIKFVKKKWAGKLYTATVNYLDLERNTAKVFDFKLRKYFYIGQDTHYVFCKKIPNEQKDFSNFLQNIIDNLPNKNSSPIEN
tara:strand:+ start:1214 stop:1561 length:348 start_codon:yes stop_codon:yes gene_type:complete